MGVGWSTLFGRFSKIHPNLWVKSPLTPISARQRWGRTKKMTKTSISIDIGLHVHLRENVDISDNGKPKFI